MKLNWPFLSSSVMLQFVYVMVQFSFMSFTLGTIWYFLSHLLFQLYFVEYKHVKQVQISHDLCNAQNWFNRFCLVLLHLSTTQNIQKQSKVRISKKKTITYMCIRQCSVCFRCAFLLVICVLTHPISNLYRK